MRRRGGLRRVVRGRGAGLKAEPFIPSARVREALAGRGVQGPGDREVLRRAALPAGGGWTT